MDWRPIETAQKIPGKTIRIGWFAGPPEDYPCETEMRAYWTVHSGWFCPDRKEGNWTPTHWKPEGK